MDPKKDVPELRPYQIAHLSFYIREKRCLDLSDPGTGKTPSACVYAQYLWEHERKRVVMTMPKSLLNKNRQEMLRFTQFEDHEIVVVDGSAKQRMKAIADPRHVVFLMGFQAFAKHWQDLAAAHGPGWAVIADEVHMGFGGSTSQRTADFWQATAQKRGPFQNYLGMTGTLIDGKLSSAFPSIHTINPLYYGSYDAFRMEHAIEDEYGNVVAWRNPEKIKQILGRHAVRQTFEGAYGKEAKVIIPEVCELSAKQAAAYLEFEEQALLELEEDWLDGTVAAVQAIRCRQIMGAPELFDIHKPDDLTGKDERLLIHLEHAKQTGEALVIFASLVPEQERIFRLVKKLGLRAGLINGGVSMAERNRIDERFRTGEIQVIVGSPATAAVGFNWERTSTIVFTSLDYKDSNFVQGYRRAVRGKRETPVRIYVMQYETKVEQRILEIVEAKSKLANKVDDSKEVFSLRAASDEVERRTWEPPPKRGLAMRDVLSGAGRPV